MAVLDNKAKTHNENIFFFIFCVLRGIDSPEKSAGKVVDYYVQSDLCGETNKELAEINRMLTEDVFWRLLNHAKPGAALEEIIGIWE